MDLVSTAPPTTPTVTVDPARPPRESSLLRYRRSVGSDLLTKTSLWAEFSDELRDRAHYGYRIRIADRAGGQARVVADGGEERWVVDATSNDYLGLAHDPRVTAATTEAIERFGVGSRGAAMLNGNVEVHHDLARELADFLGFEAVMLTPSGFGAMQGTCQGLLTPTDAVFADRYCHASIDTGLRLSGSRIYRYPHGDVEALERLLADHRDRHRGAMIATDGLFSVEGSVSPIEELVRLACAYECTLFVDDAHGIGSLHGGRGCAAIEGVDILAGTLSKGFGSGGGFVASTRGVIEYVSFFGTAACTTTNLSVANSAAALAALRIMRSEPERTARLVSLSRRVRRGLREAGLDVADHDTPIINLVVGRDSAAFAAWRALFDNGVLGHALPFPIVAHGRSAIRLRLTVAMDDSDAEQLVEIVGSTLGRREPDVVPVVGAAARSLCSLGFVSSQVETSDGTLAVHERRGDGPTLVLLHPLLFDSEIWADVVERLPSDARIVAIDAPGHGASVARRDLTLDQLAAGVADVLGGFGGPPPVVVGSSMGGMVAMRLACRDEVELGGLVLVGTSADEEEGPSRVYLEPLTDIARSIGAGSISEEIATVMFSPDFVHRAHDRCAALLAALERADVESLAPAVRAVLDRPSIIDQLDGLALPTVVVVGDEDLAEPVPHSEQIVERLVGASLRVVDGCGHLVPLEAPDEVASAVRSVIEAVPIGS